MTRRAQWVVALVAKCEELGGSFRLISPEQFYTMFIAKGHCPNNHESPFARHLGVNHKRKTVYAAVDSAESQIGALIHEIAHVFATRKGPDACKEFDFLGWEIALAREIGCYRTWSADNSDYAVGDDGTMWRYLSAKRRADIVRERVAYAQKIGIVDANGRVRSARR